MRKISIVLLLTFLIFICYSQESEKKLRKLPSVDIKTLEGGNFNTSNISNDGKTLIISFWAIWCKPCIKELTTIAEVYDEWQEETDVKLIAISIDDSRRMLSSRDTDFGFSTDLYVDGVPVFEDKDCNTDDWWLIDLETHRVAIWVPPTIERLGETADSEDAFIKMYFATYNRAPRRLVQIYGCATS